NTGDTVWIEGGEEAGCVNLALRSGTPGSASFLEAEPRKPLPARVRPGETMALEATFRLPPTRAEGSWEVDLVSEKMFWFSSRGTRTAAPSLGPAAQRKSD